MGLFELWVIAVKTSTQKEKQCYPNLPYIQSVRGPFLQECEHEIYQTAMNIETVYCSKQWVTPTRLLAVSAESREYTRIPILPFPIYAAVVLWPINR
jgi:hypothetical protein